MFMVFVHLSCLRFCVFKINIALCDSHKMWLVLLFQQFSSVNGLQP